MRILLIEDDEILMDLLRQALTSQHYTVDSAEDGQTGWNYAQSANYDLIVMDVGLPKLDGISLCQKLRAAGYTTPILLITAKEAKSDRIRGLDAGADDYLIKPLEFSEFQARIRALLRRGDVLPSTILQLGALRLDPTCCQASYGSKLLNLTPKEYSLLELLLRHPSRVFSRGQIVEHLWSFDDPPLEESVKAHIKGLRQKLKNAGAVDWIENVYGIGYRLREGIGDITEQNPEPASAKTQPSEQLADPEQSIAEIETETETKTKTKTKTEQTFKQASEKLWQQYQGLMLERMQVLHSMVAAAQTETLSLELRQAAGQAAHKLAGVLGMFDRNAGTELARQLEQQLQGEQPLQPAQVHQLTQLVHQLSASLNLSDPPTVAPDSPVSLVSAPAPPMGTRILVVDDDPLFLAALRPMVEPWGIQMTELVQPLMFWQVLPKVAPDLLILDVEMPQISGIGLCQAVRANGDWQGLPILFLTAHQESEIIQQIFAAGADDYVTKPIVGAELLTRIHNRLERNRLLQSLSSKDPLTGLANQPQSSRSLEQLRQQSERDRCGFCLAVFTVTELRQINHQYGHLAGNQVLQRWGQLFQTLFQTLPSAISGYWGNGEFVVGLAGLSKAETQDRLAELRLTLRQQIFIAPDGNRFQTHFTVGVAEFPGDGLSLQSLYQSASVAHDPT